MKKNYRKNLLFVLILIAMMFIIIGAKSDFEAIWAEIKHSNGKFLILAFFNVIIYWIFWFIPFITLANYLNNQLKLIDTIAIGSSEFFFNGITPFGTGGSPIQIYLLKKINVNTANSTGIVLTNFITYQLINNLICVFGIIFYYNTLKGQLDHFLIIILITFLGNFLLLVLFLLMVYSPKFANFIHYIFKILAKIKFLNKRVTLLQTKTHIFVENMQLYCKDMLSNKKIMFKVYFTKTISVLAYYLTPFFVLLALDVKLEASSFALILVATALATCVYTWIPTPGGTGGAELAFTLMFIPLLGVTDTTAVAGALLWRFFNYYLTMFYGFIMYLIFKRRRQIYENRTFY